MTWEEKEGLYLVWQHSISSEHSVEKFWYIVKDIFSRGLIIVRVAKEEVKISQYSLYIPSIRSLMMDKRAKGKGRLTTRSFSLAGILNAILPSCKNHCFEISLSR